MSANGKSIGEVREFEERKVLLFAKLSRYFFHETKLNKKCGMEK